MEAASVSASKAEEGSQRRLVFGEVGALRSVVEADIAAYESEVGHNLPADLKADLRLARFMDAYSHDVEAAAKAYRDMLQWRKDQEVEKLRKEHLGEMAALHQKSLPHWEEIRNAGEYGPWMLAGKSHHGDIVHLEAIGASDPTALMEKVPEEKIVEHYIGFFEIRAKLLDELSEESGRIVRTVQIRDLSRFGMGLIKHASAMKMLSAVMKLGSANYPESSSRVIFIHTPNSFYPFWKAASMVLRKRTLDKVLFLGSDYHRELLKLVEPRVVHRMEKMQTLDDHGFIEKGEEEDHLPLEYIKTLSVPAGGSQYLSIYMTRSGLRSKVTILLSAGEESEIAAAASAPPPEFDLVFLSSAMSDEGPVVTETRLLPKAFATEDPTKFVVNFPEMLPENITDGFLLVNFENKTSWISSLQMPITARFDE